jgi:L-ascorbate metabolism protein UlaG (beta-lactamase superfamily)
MERPLAPGRLRRAAVTVLLASAALAGSVVTTGCLLSAPGYEGPATPYFDGKRFRNEEPQPHGFGDFLRWITNRDRGPWPAEALPVPPAPPPPERVAGGGLRVTFVNHSTVLVQVDGLNLLTDPVWSDRVGPASWLGVKRLRAPGLRLEDLPPIDAILVSHNHYDHLDVPTLRALSGRFGAPVITGLGNSELLRRKGIPGGVDLDWWQSTPIAPGVTVTAVPAAHFSGRGLFDRDRTLWCGFVVEGPSGRVYFAGDTGRGPHFAEVRRRFGPVRLALLPIGAYRPRWFMSPVHVDPAEAVEAARVLEAGTSVGIHFGTFPQADDGIEEPVRDLEAALGSLRREGLAPPRFLALGNGESADVPAAP